MKYTLVIFLLSLFSITLVNAQGIDKIMKLVRGAYLFDRNQGGADNCGEIKKIVPSDPAHDNQFGLSVSIESTYIIIGADGSVSNDRAANLFSKDQDGVDIWGQVRRLISSNPQVGDKLGCSTAIKGDLDIVDAYYQNKGPGIVLVYQKDEGGTDLILICNNMARNCTYREGHNV